MQHAQIVHSQWRLWHGFIIHYCVPINVNSFILAYYLLAYVRTCGGFILFHSFCVFVFPAEVRIHWIRICEYFSAPKMVWWHFTWLVAFMLLVLRLLKKMYDLIIMPEFSQTLWAHCCPCTLHSVSIKNERTNEKEKKLLQHYLLCVDDVMIASVLLNSVQKMNVWMCETARFKRPNSPKSKFSTKFNAKFHNALIWKMTFNCWIWL